MKKTWLTFLFVGAACLVAAYFIYRSEKNKAETTDQEETDQEQIGKENKPGNETTDVKTE